MMSNSLAIAAVTSTLRSMLDSASGGLTANLPADIPSSLGLGSVSVTTKTPDKARPSAETANQVNIYLYQTAPNAAFCNMDMPRKARPGEIAQPPVALTLHYLLSAYGHNDDETAAHILLGQAMRIFHDNAVLDHSAIRAALGGNDLYEQVEHVRISPQPLSIEEISKLWTAFQTQYRISSAYRVEVVLIESSRPSQAPLPVLTRGKDDSGPSAVAGNSLPVITSVLPPNRQSSAFLGDELTIAGQNLNNLSAVRFTLINSRADTPAILLPPAAVQVIQDGIKVTLPNDVAAQTTWVAGFYTVAVVVNRTLNGTSQTWSSNELPLSLAPRIQKIEPANPIPRDAGGKVTLAVTCQPQVKLAVVDPTHMRFDQQVVLLLGTARQIAPEAPPPPPAIPAQPPTSSDKLTFLFPVSAAELGEYLVRLRVDGVDLPMVDRTVTPPTFDASQKVTIA
ncbi:MAG TPA: DUF4255 domain-containing protein [Candidatus Udaeobacter sp.]|nr:DUF4255 domain-containing protein [Candidatus Udaeobacter sp.]